MKRLAGVYLVIDPTKPWEILFKKLEAALAGGVNIVQVWNHWPESVDREQKLQFINKAKIITNIFEVPLLMHDDWQLAQQTNMAGVHFDHLPDEFNAIQETTNLQYIGITVGNDLELIKWADAHSVSYISFCAIFPSPSVASCDIVDQEKIKQTHEISNLPIFLSGGLTYENLDQLKDLPFDGIAVISGIMSAEDPKQAVKAYINKLEEIKAHKLNN